MTKLWRSLLVPAVCLVLITGTTDAKAQACRDMDAVGVAVGALVGGVLVLGASFIGPGVAVAQDDSLSYWEGFGWTFLAGAIGVGIGSLVASTVACDHGLWLPGVVGLTGGVVGTVLWADGASERERADLALTAAPIRFHAGLAPFPGGGGLRIGMRL